MLGVGGVEPDGPAMIVMCSKAVSSAVAKVQLLIPHDHAAKGSPASRHIKKAFECWAVLGPCVLYSTYMQCFIKCLTLCAAQCAAHVDQTHCDGSKALARKSLHH